MEPFRPSVLNATELHSYNAVTDRMGRLPDASPPQSLPSVCGIPARQLVMRGMDKRHVGSDKTRFLDLARDVRGEDNLDGLRRA